MDVRSDVPLAPLTTLELGGHAEFFVVARSTGEVLEALDWAQGRAVTILAGGSNVVVPDEGIEGLVVQLASRGVEDLGDGRCKVAAGEPWDAFVARCVAGDLAGVECLAGIPGSVGATPIQNVGAYGQDVSQTIAEVGVLDLSTGQRVTRSAKQCGFAYRHSDFKDHPHRYLVLDVTFALTPGGSPMLRYGELQSRVGAGASLAEVRHTILTLRRSKSMVHDPSDPNHRSAGSFFTNPIVDNSIAQRVVELALSRGVVTDAADVPRWPAGDQTKLAAGWLIERAGFAKGTRRGRVGLSTKHALALVHHGGGRTRELLEFAEEIRAGVEACFGVSLTREPRMLGPLIAAR